MRRKNFPPHAKAAAHPPWEIVENLHRADLTELERKEQTAEWIRLADAEEIGAGDLQLAQVAPIESKREDGRGHRHEGGMQRCILPD